MPLTDGFGVPSTPGHDVSEALFPSPEVERFAEAVPSPALPVAVHVHLAYGFDAESWRGRWERGELLGLNEPTPYGYGWAEGRVRRLRYSRDRAEGRLGRLMRLGVRAVLGFDFLHAYANRHAIAASDVVWTHTESQFLAVAALAKLRSGRRPALIAQSVWLFDGWDRLPALRRRFFRWLIAEADILTVHSPANLATAQRLFPEKRAELVRFGIAADRLRPAARRASGRRPFRVLSLGNDRHRDWRTVVEAVRGLADVQLTIVSATCPRETTAGVSNAQIRSVRTNEALGSLFRESDLVVVPLRHNEHASGITVLQEAAAMGLAAVASDTGGLRAYFAPDEVAYVPVGDAEALRRAIEALRDDDEDRFRRAVRAQQRMGAEGHSSRAFVERHLEITRSLTMREAPIA